MRDKALGLPADDAAAAHDALIQEYKALSDADAVTHLAALDPLQYDRQRKAAAEALNVREPTLDSLVKAAKPIGGAKQGRALELHHAEPCDEPVDGDALLDDIRAAIERYVVLPPHASVAIALWVVHTYAVGATFHTPRLLFKSPEMRCGKTTALGVLKRLVCRPLQAANISAAAVFRTVEALQPTLLVDEADTFLGKHDDLRGVINSGHSKDGAVVKVDGEDNEPRVFATFAATAIAAIGHLPGTIEDRSIIIQMKRKKASEKVIRLRGDQTPDLDDLSRQCRRWVDDHMVALRASDAEPPAALSDRAADGWRPLNCIAELAGGEWPDLARQASVALMSVDDEESIRVMLLKDIKAIFDAQAVDRLSSEAIVDDLRQMEERPWDEYGKARKPITKNKLADLLKPFGVRPGKVRIGSLTPNGYRLEQFRDAFERYLSVRNGEAPPLEVEQWNKPQKTAAFEAHQSGTLNGGVPVSNQPKPAENCAMFQCSGSNDPTAPTRVRPPGPNGETNPDDPSTYLDDSDYPLSPETREANRVMGDLPPQFDRRPSHMTKRSA